MAVDVLDGSNIAYESCHSIRATGYFISASKRVFDQKPLRDPGLTIDMLVEKGNFLAGRSKFRRVLSFLSGLF
jgi:hypothetical protein